MVWCPSVCPSICLSHSHAAAACNRFAAVSLVRRQYRSIAAWHVCSRRSRLTVHVHSSATVSSKCERAMLCLQQRRKLDMDLFVYWSFCGATPCWAKSCKENLWDNYFSRFFTRFMPLSLSQQYQNTVKYFNKSSRLLCLI